MRISLPLFLSLSLSAFTVTNGAFISSSRRAFANEQQQQQLASSNIVLMSTSSSNNNNNAAGKGEATGEIKASLKKMRGISVSVEYNPIDTDTGDTNKEISPMEMEILSQELRKAKAASIWTSNLNAVELFSKEQIAAKGNFPGPCPIIYKGEGNGDKLQVKQNVQAAIEKGATAFVVNVDNINVDIDLDLDLDLEKKVDIICRVKSAEDVHRALEAGYEYAFLVPGSEVDISNQDLQTILGAIPKSAVVVATIPSMQNESAEIARGKELATLVVAVPTESESESESSKISGILIEDACVGDAEDLKYTAFVVENINKKSSSTFQMTGLTGAANGHFGSELSGGLQSAKWRRMECTCT